MVAFETVTNQYLGGDTSLACSEETAAKIGRGCDCADSGISAESGRDSARKRAEVNELSEYLLERETITGAGIYGNIKPVENVSGVSNRRPAAAVFSCRDETFDLHRKKELLKELLLFSDGGSALFFRRTDTNERKGSGPNCHCEKKHYKIPHGVRRIMTGKERVKRSFSKRLQQYHTGSPQGEFQ